MFPMLKDPFGLLDVDGQSDCVFSIPKLTQDGNLDRHQRLVDSRSSQVLCRHVWPNLGAPHPWFDICLRLWFVDPNQLLELVSHGMEARMSRLTSKMPRIPAKIAMLKRWVRHSKVEHRGYLSVSLREIERCESLTGETCQQSRCSR